MRPALQVCRPGPAELRLRAELFAVPLPSVRSEIMEVPLAPKAAAALGLLFPYVGLPVGMVFLMLEIRARQSSAG